MLTGFRTPQKVAVFISGGGSTLQSLLEMHHQFDVKLVVSNKKSATGVLKAKRFGKAVHFINKDTPYDELTKTLRQHNISLIILAGFMKILPHKFVEEWANKMINIHPSLLPLHKGLEAAEKSWADNETMGVSLHYVTEEMDEGRIFLQKKSLNDPRNLKFNEADLFLRKTEQHLLRELTYRCYA